MRRVEAPVRAVGTMKRVLGHMDILQDGFARPGSLQLLSKLVVIVAGLNTRDQLPTRGLLKQAELIWGQVWEPYESYACIDV